MDFSLMKDFMDRLTDWRIPGNGISVCIDGKEVFSYNSGFADLENKIPMTNNHLLNIYSCTKVATVTAALQLYEQGYFLLDDPLYTLIPEYKDMYIKNPDGSISKAKNHITMRHLFTMTSGLSYDETNVVKRARELTNGNIDTLSFVKCLAEDPISFEPGTQWQYSWSHDVLGAAVEVISGKKFRDYVKENIFDPLEMKDSYFHSKELLDRMAQQYHFKSSDETDEVKLQAAGSLISMADGVVFNSKRSRADGFGPEFDSGGGGIVSSISDYSKFCSALANGGVGQNGERIISSGTIDLMRTNQLTPDISKNFNWEQLKGYGYGLGVRTLIDKAASGSTGNIGEFGWGGAAGANVLIDPSIKLSAFYAHHMLNPQESYYQPRLRNVLYACVNR
ncbi:MAG: beta-lactamase family protein [Clostridia bacterium]|nr:beta-lactamase family protein [Clostridia bacterium]MBQ7046893.1 beta-lactamase family protein [Oscillospiraceae bacterium]